MSVQMFLVQDSGLWNLGFSDGAAKQTKTTSRDWEHKNTLRTGAAVASANASNA